MRLLSVCLLLALVLVLPASAGAKTKRCSGSVAYGFFTDIRVTNTSCPNAMGVLRRWVKRSGFGTQTPPAKLKVGRWTCRLVMVEGEDNPYGRLTCRRPHKRIRAYGRS